MELQGKLFEYAENIWRRFPEVFLALGSPCFEDYFEMRADGWHQRVISTESEKVIEIRLPRRNSHVGKAPCIAGASEQQFDQLQARLEDEGILLAIDDIMQRVAGLDDRVASCLVREIDARFPVAGGLMEEIMANTQMGKRCSMAFLKRASEHHRTLDLSMDTSWQQVTNDQEQTQQPVWQPMEPTQSWVSRLAFRRGLALPNVQTTRLGKEPPECVIRRPELDRIGGHPVSLPGGVKGTAANPTAADTVHSGGVECTAYNVAVAEEPRQVARREQHLLGDCRPGGAADSTGAGIEWFDEQLKSRAIGQQGSVLDESRQGHNRQDDPGGRGTYDSDVSGQAYVHSIVDLGKCPSGWLPLPGPSTALYEDSTTAPDMRLEQSPSASTFEDTPPPSYDTHQPALVHGGADEYRVVAMGDSEPGSPVRMRRNTEGASIGPKGAQVVSEPTAAFNKNFLAEPPGPGVRCAPVMATGGGLFCDEQRRW